MLLVGLYASLEAEVRAGHLQEQELDALQLELAMCRRATRGTSSAPTVAEMATRHWTADSQRWSGQRACALVAANQAMSLAHALTRPPVEDADQSQPSWMMGSACVQCLPSLLWMRRGFSRCDVELSAAHMGRSSVTLSGPSPAAMATAFKRLALQTGSLYFHHRPRRVFPLFLYPLQLRV